MKTIEESATISAADLWEYGSESRWPDPAKLRSVEGPDTIKSYYPDSTYHGSRRVLGVPCDLRYDTEDICRMRAIVAKAIEDVEKTTNL